MKRIFTLQKETERVKEREKQEQLREQEVTNFTDNNGSDDSLPMTYHTKINGAGTMPTLASCVFLPLGVARERARGVPTGGFWQSGSIGSILLVSRRWSRREQEGDGYGPRGSGQPDYEGIGRIGRLSRSSLRVCAGFLGRPDRGAPTAGNGSGMEGG